MFPPGEGAQGSGKLDGELYLKTDITLADLFEATGRLRRNEA
jgi:hypothetical protein